MNKIMNNLFPLPILYSILTFICILIAVQASHGDVGKQYEDCKSPSKCGTQGILYPFWADKIRPQYCGRKGFELQCHENAYLTMQMGAQSFQVLGINDPDRTMTIARDSFQEGKLCRMFSQATVINHTFFNYTENVRNLSLFFNCIDSLKEGKNNFNCTAEGRVINSFYNFDDGFNDELPLRNLSNTCSSVIKVPVLLTPMNHGYLLEGKLQEALNGGFEVRYGADNESSCLACSYSQGMCGSNQTSNEFACLCPDAPQTVTCRTGSPPGNPKVKILIGSFAGIMGIIITGIIICISRWKKYSSILSTACCRKVIKCDQDLEAFIRNCGPLASRRYSFSNVKKMCNSFKDKLGQGGYGSVYKGKLSDGRLIAVKLLNTSKGDGQEFINEVASISKTSHVNVVKLLGFCLEGSKRALIYEFMPNGSLEKFIYSGDTSKPGQQLGWEKMYEIVIGIAKGLEYLHRGCNTRILHFDIKPRNILLDQDFCPKISDFGMAKLCLKKESIESMLEARGTIGYIAPEVFSRNFGEVSHKSDVYSFGMMILELVGCKNNLNTGADRSSEIYFPHWIYKHFERDSEFKVPGIVTSEENEIAKKMIVVGLWCIQTHPSDRPSVNRVIEMLQSSNDALKIPPKPFASSPPRLPIDSSTISML